MRIKSRGKWKWIVAGLVATAVIGVVRYFTGPELALSFFYFIPILVTTWYVNGKTGVLMSFASAASWLSADLLMLGQFSHLWVPFLNETLRLLVFLIIAIGFSELKKTIELKDLALQAARTDALTGIGNRRLFYDFATREMSRASRYNRPFSVAYLDVDNFKQVNDTRGHFVGDAILMVVAAALKENIRPMDVCSRLGGDEFVVLFPEIDAVAARTVGRRLQKSLQDAMRSHDWPVTFSIGMVTFRRSPYTVDELLQKADQAMYIAKTIKNHIEYEVIPTEDTPFVAAFEEE